MLPMDAVLDFCSMGRRQRTAQGSSKVYSSWNCIRAMSSLTSCRWKGTGMTFPVIGSTPLSSSWLPSNPNPRVRETRYCQVPVPCRMEPRPDPSAPASGAFGLVQAGQPWAQSDGPAHNCIKNSSNSQSDNRGPRIICFLSLS